MRTLAAAILCLSTAASAQTIYRWTDKKGEVHYTDDRSTVPPGAKLETTEGEELMVVPAPPPAPNVPAAVIKKAERPAPPAPKKPQSGPVEVKLSAVNVPVSDPDRQYIEESLRAAAASPRLAAWGGLRESVDVEIATAQQMVGYAGTDAFGRAVGSHKMQLRAPQDVRSWGHALDYPGAALHELAHLLEHQVAGTNRPPWFAEGFASLVAGEVRRPMDDIAWWVIHEGGEQPLEGLFNGKCNVGLAYAIAMQAVSYLVELVGEAGIKDMFEARAKGQAFEAAFAKVAGFSTLDFQARFIKSLRPSYYERAR